MRFKLKKISNENNFNRAVLLIMKGENEENRKILKEIFRKIYSECDNVTIRCVPDESYHLGRKRIFIESKDDIEDAVNSFGDYCYDIAIRFNIGDTNFAIDMISELWTMVITCHSDGNLMKVISKFL